MSVADLILTTANVSATPSVAYVDDVFSTYLYTGSNGTDQTITNGVDLSTYGGMVWIKNKLTGSVSQNHAIFDTARGVYQQLYSDLTDASINLTAYGQGLKSFNTNGFTLGPYGTSFNYNNESYVSWTFRKSPKFFDVVTYTGDGTSNRNIVHNLGITPGMITIKRTAAISDWETWHRSLTSGAGYYVAWNNANVQSYNANSFGTPHTASVFNVGSGYLNTSGVTYVAYLFAHDSSSTGLIQCGTSTGGTSTVVNLGWEPQWVMVKKINATQDWFIMDIARGFTATQGDVALSANTNAAEPTASSNFNISATGFTFAGLGSTSDTYIYIAIRRPNKPPTSGTQVFSPSTSTVSNGVINSGFPTDVIMSYVRPAVVTNTYNRMVQNRVIGKFAICNPQSGAVGSAFNDTASFASNLGVVLNGNATYPSGYSHLQFKRAPGFMDVVVYLGTQTDRSINHSLGVVPELIICLDYQTFGTNSLVFHSQFSANNFLYFSSDSALNTYNIWSSLPTTTQFSLSSDYTINRNNNKFTALLFATLAGISKVGSYTGNGSSQTINCSFSAGARLILIKRTDSTGDWYVWDTARGIISGNDPHLSINTTVAEVTTDDSIDPDNSGFIVNQVAATNINVTSASYIFLAIA